MCADDKSNSLNIRREIIRNLRSINTTYKWGYNILLCLNYKQKFVRDFLIVLMVDQEIYLSFVDKVEPAEFAEINF